MVPLAFLANLSAASLREALAEFETGATSPVACAADQKIGRSKEVSRFQILPGLWQQYTTSLDYADPETAWAVAKSILQERRETFQRVTGRDWNYFELYLMWNAPGAYRRAEWDRTRLSPVVLERAERLAIVLNVGRNGAGDGGWIKTFRKLQLQTVKDQRDADRCEPSQPQPS